MGTASTAPTILAVFPWFVLCSGLMTTSLELYTWIATQRGVVLAELLALRRIGFRVQEWTKDHGDRAYGWNRLVGAGFALWRALPLIHSLEGATGEEDTQGHLPAIHVDHANRLLHELILHNRVGYEQDQSTHDWMAGYYLNDAEDRIMSVLLVDLKPDITASGETLNAAAIVAKNASTSSAKLRLGRQTRWHQALAGLKELTEFLEQQLH